MFKLTYLDTKVGQEIKYCFTFLLITFDLQHVQRKLRYHLVWNFKANVKNNHRHENSFPTINLWTKQSSLYSHETWDGVWVVIAISSLQVRHITKFWKNGALLNNNFERTITLTNISIENGM